MVVEIVHEHLDFGVGVLGGRSLNGADFVQGGFDTRVDFGVKIEGASDCLDAAGAGEIKRC